MAKWRMRTKSEQDKISRRISRKTDSPDLPPYVMPHKYLPLVRGIPIRDHTKPAAVSSKLPPMSLPIEAQNSFAYHLEMVGLVHVDDLLKLANESGYIHIDDLPPVYLKHLKPVEGPDIQLNPGTWVPASTITEEEIENDEVSSMVDEVEIPIDIETASAAELEALERVLRAARIDKIRRYNVDAQVKEELGDTT